MNPNLIEGLLAVAFAISLAIWLGWLFGRRGRSNAPLGLPEGSVRGILAISIVAAVLLSPAFGSEVPEFLKGAFGVIIGLYFGTRGASSGLPAAIPTDLGLATARGTTAAVQAPPAAAQPPPAPASAQAGSAGSASLGQIGALAIVSLIFAVAFFTPGCATSDATKAAAGIAQPYVDGLAAKYGMTNKLAGVRNGLAEAEAKKSGRTILPADAEALPEIFVDDAGSLLTNGVTAVQWYKVQNRIADRAANSAKPPTIAPTPAATATATDAPRLPVATPSVSALSGGATTLPPPDQVRDSATTGAPVPAPVAGAGGPPSTAISVPSIVEVRSYRLTGHATKAIGAMADVIKDAVIVADVSISGAPGFELSSGNVLASGSVVALSNAPAVNTKSLAFADYPASVAGGVLTVSSRSSDAIQFVGTANFSSGDFSAVLSPTVGSSASVFFQSLELSGSATLTGVATNAAHEVTASQPSQDPMLRSAKWNKFPRVEFDAPEIEAWPDDGSSKKIIGILLLNGRKVEHVGAGRQWANVENALVAVDPKTGKPGKYYRPELKSGQTVTIAIQSNDGKKTTNALELIWP